MKGYLLRDARRLAIGTSDWREAVWNKWLVSYLTPKEEAGQPGSQVPAAGERPDSEDESPAVAMRQAPQAEPGSAAATSEAASAVPAEAPVRAGEGERDPRAPEQPAADSWVPGEGRRGQAVRAWFEQLRAQVEAVELSLDRLAERQSLGAAQERLQMRRVSDVLDRLVETQERHSETLIACSRALERLERRMMWHERLLRTALPFGMESGDSDAGWESPRESLAPPSRSQVASRSRIPPRPGPDLSAPLAGKLSEISLPTLLSMAELEKWTGRLTLESQGTVIIDLEGGLIVGALDEDAPCDAVDAVVSLMETRDGRFSFTPFATALKTERPPLTVGSLLLKASHRRDELNRVG